MTGNSTTSASAGGYRELLLRAGASGLSEEEIDVLVPGLIAIDRKIEILRRSAKDLRTAPDPV